MKPNPVYNFILQGQLAAAAAEQKLFQHETTAGGRHFFKHSPPAPAGTTFVLENGVRYTVTEQHLSIYKKCKDNDNLLQAYHFTVTLTQADGSEAVLHVYFDQQGVCREVTLKQGEEWLELTEADKQRLKNYAQAQSGPLINTLNSAIAEEQEKLLQQITDKGLHLAYLNSKLKSKLTEYIAELKKVIVLLKRFNPLSRNSLIGAQRFYEGVLEVREAEQQGSPLSTLPQSLRIEATPAIE